MKSKTWAILLGAMLLLCLGLSFMLMEPGEQATVAEIWSDGKLVERVRLQADREIVVASEKGSNTVTVRDGKIAVTAADCPDHHCMARGYCDRGTQIVCLPNRLVIKFIGKQDADTVVG